MYGGLRAKGTKADLALIVCDGEAVAAGVFTLNVMCAAPVLYCKEVLEKRETVRAVLVSVGREWEGGQGGRGRGAGAQKSFTASAANAAAFRHLHSIPDIPPRFLPRPTHRRHR
jgi:N-acetylglutamate synthase/N-acetylornithine aminotransferase